MSDLRPGIVLADRYRVLAHLGSGGGGSVFHVRDESDGRDVALKVLHTGTADDLLQLKREFRVRRSLRLDGVVEFLALVTDSSPAFLTMELVEGETLGARLLRWRQCTERPLEEIRAVFAALARIVHGLHEAGVLHRDLKPDNVILGSRGPVLVDFGFATHRDRTTHDGLEAGFLGTPGYAAPEQRWGRAPTPAADWHGFGAMLGEAVLGKLARREELLATAIDFGELAAALLATNPDDRPNGSAILRALGAGASIEPPRPRRLVGRDAELTALRLAAETAQRERRLVCVRIDGPAGMGKTTIAHAFTGDLEASADWIVLRGACDPGEAVAFGALDGLVDDLTRILTRVEHRDIVESLRADLARLSIAFPVVSRLLGSQPLESIVEPFEARRRAFASFIAVVDALPPSMLLALWIDDLHWCDPDSASAIDVLVRSWPRRATVWLSTQRADGPFQPSAVPEDSLHLELGPLDPASAVAVAETASRRTATLAPAEIARNANGHPFMILALVRWALVGRSDEGHVVDAATIITGAFSSLPEPMRAVVSLVAVAGYRLPLAILARVLGDEARRHAQDLAMRGWLAAEPHAGQQTVAASHDTVRSTIVDALGEGERVAIHRRLAAAIETMDDADADLLVLHLEHAGLLESAPLRLLDSADRAAARYAFQRAVRAYERCLALPVQPIPRWQILRRIGEALIGDGRSVSGARRLVDAAEAAPADVAATDLAILRRQAAEHLLRGGAYDDGAAALERVLETAGLRAPASPALVALSIAWTRFRKRYVSPSLGQPTSERDRERLDTLWGAGLGYGFLNALRSFEFQARHALLAERSGDLAHLARARSTEGMILVWEGRVQNRKLALGLLADAMHLARRSREPLAQAHCEVMNAGVALLDRRLDEAIEHTERGREIVAQCNGASWEVASLDWIAGCAHADLGWFARLTPTLRRAIDRARARADEYARAMVLQGRTNAYWLALDDPDTARRHLESVEGFGMASAFYLYHGLYAHVHVDLYVGDPERGLARITAAFPRFRREFLFRLWCVKLDVLELRARCNIELARRSDQRDERRRRLDAARRDVAWIRHTKLPIASPLGDALLAGIRAVDGDRGAWRRHLDASIGGFESFGMSSRAAAGRLQAAREGSESASGPSRELRDVGIAEPERWAKVWFPGLG